MKKIQKLILTLLVALLAFSVISSADILAEETETNFITLEENQEFLVCIEWENTRPVVKFISPSGEVYDTALEQDGTQISVGDTMLYYYIENAEKGSWRIVYDKLDNENIYVTLESASSPFVVKDVKVDSVTDTDADVSFFVEYDTDRSINYKIYVSANETSRGKELKSGSCKANELTQVTVDFSSVSSYDNYKVYVYAYFDDDGVDIFDGAYSQPFKYANPNQTDMTSPTNLVIMPNELSAVINWEPKAGYTYIVSMFENEQDEPAVFEEISDTSVESYDFAIDPDTEKIEIRIAEKYGKNNYSNEKIYTVDMTALPSVEFEDAVSTNKGYVSFHYSNFIEKNRVEIELNGERKEVNLYAEQEGNLEVEVNQDVNTVSVIYHIDDEISAVYEKYIYFNNEPPRIYMLNDYTDVVTDKSIIELIGSVQGAEKVFVADNEVTVAADGSFSYTARLKEGENVISIEAYDILGNGSAYTAKVTYKPSQKVTDGTVSDDQAFDEDEASGKETFKFAQIVKDFLPGIVSFAVGLILIIVVAVLPKKKKKAGVLCTLRKIVIYLLTLGAAVDVYFIFNWLKLKNRISSIDFIETAYDSVEQAGTLLAAEAKWKKYTIYASIEVGVCVLILVLLIGFNTIIKKRQADKEVPTGQNDSNQDQTIQ